MIPHEAAVELCKIRLYDKLKTILSEGEALYYDDVMEGPLVIGFKDFTIETQELRHVTFIKALIISDEYTRPGFYVTVKLDKSWNWPNMAQLEDFVDREFMIIKSVPKSELGRMLYAGGKEDNSD